MQLLSEEVNKKKYEKAFWACTRNIFHGFRTEEYSKDALKLSNSVTDFKVIRKTE